MAGTVACLQDIACRILRDSFIRDVISPEELEQDGHIFTLHFRRHLARHELQGPSLSGQSPPHVADVGEPTDLTARQQSSARRSITVDLHTQAITQGKDALYYGDAVPVDSIDIAEHIISGHPLRSTELNIAPQDQSASNCVHHDDLERCRDIVPCSDQRAAIGNCTLGSFQSGEYPRTPGLKIQPVAGFKVPDTAQSIRFAMHGDIDGLIRLFRQGLASPWDMSTSRGFSLVRVSPGRFLRQVETMLKSFSGHFTAARTTIKLSSFYLA